MLAPQYVLYLAAIPEFGGLHDHTRDLDMGFWFYNLTVDDTGLQVTLITLASKAGEANNCSLLLLQRSHWRGSP